MAFKKSQALGQLTIRGIPAHRRRDWPTVATVASPSAWAEVTQIAPCPKVAPRLRQNGANRGLVFRIFDLFINDLWNSSAWHPSCTLPGSKRLRTNKTLNH
jgi:hypothetical protein